MFHSRGATQSASRFGTRQVSFAALTGRAYYRAKRALTFLGSSAFVLAGFGLTGFAAYSLWGVLLAPSSDVVIFNKAFGLIEKDQKVKDVLGSKLKGHGESTNNRWNHTRPIASRRGLDRYGREHITMRFVVEGMKGKGLARLELIDDMKGHRDFRYLLVELPNYGIHYIINEVPQSSRKKGWFGLSWS